MNFDVMQRLYAIKPLPRGERLARFCEGIDGKTRFTRPLWDRLLAQGTIGAMGKVYGAQVGADKMWRAFAAPLRKCREERNKWKYIFHNLRIELQDAQRTLMHYRQYTPEYWANHAIDFATNVAAQGAIGDGTGTLDSMFRTDVTEAMEFLEEHGKFKIEETLSDRRVRGKLIR